MTNINTSESNDYIPTYDSGNRICQNCHHIHHTFNLTRAAPSSSLLAIAFSTTAEMIPEATIIITPRREPTTSEVSTTPQVFNMKPSPLRANTTPPAANCIENVRISLSSITCIELWKWKVDGSGLTSRCASLHLHSSLMAPDSYRRSLKCKQLTLNIDYEDHLMFISWIPRSYYDNMIRHVLES